MRFTIKITLNLVLDLPMVMMVWLRVFDVDIIHQFFHANVIDWLQLSLI